MSGPLHVQIALDHPMASVYRAVTDEAALATWFAEHTEVRLAEKRYDFWGRFTPDCPDRVAGRHPIEEPLATSRIRYEWPLRDTSSSVEMRLLERNERTYLGVWHHDIPESLRGSPDSFAMEDFWFLSLENLRRYLAGRPVIRCDFSAIGATNQINHTVEIDAPVSAVWDVLITPAQLDRWIASRAHVDLQKGGEWNLGWMEEARLEILSLSPEKALSVRWDIGETPTVLTWTLEGSGGKTRLTLVHSGFAPDARVDGLEAGWLNFMSWLKSAVEFGPDWIPTLKEITIAASAYYAASIWEHQDELISRDDSIWG